MKIKAAVVREINQLAIETVELDPPQANEVLVRVKAAGVCHSDLHALRGELRPRPPVVLGHVGKHQLIQQKIAYMVQRYEIARLLYLRAGWLKNQGIRNTLETSLAKWHATDASFEAANDAIQVHGAYGYSDEHDVERYLRNARGAIIYEGTSEIHQLMQVSYALGDREDGALRCELPAYDPKVWQE
jgi:hypothetical protein